MPRYYCKSRGANTPSSQADSLWVLTGLILFLGRKGAVRKELLFRRLRQRDHRFNPSLDNLVRQTFPPKEH